MKKSQDTEHKPILQMGSVRMPLRNTFHKPFTVRFPDKCEWQDRFNPNNKGTRSVTRTGPRSIKTLVLGCIDGLEKGHPFSIWLHTMVIQDEIYVIKACIMGNTEKGYMGRNIYILSNSQTAIKAVYSFHINSELF